MEKEFELYDGEVIALPARWEVCFRCNGNGSHTNPSIDGNGLTLEDFANDPDFADDYFDGVYDIACEECGGRTTVMVVDDRNLDSKQVKDYERLQAFWEDEADYAALVAAERRMGC